MYIILPMAVRTYTQARANLARLMDEVCDSRAPLIITRQKAGAVVMISLEEYEGMEETMHLLRSPENAKRLQKGIAELNAGRGVKRKLIKPKL